MKLETKHFIGWIVFFMIVLGGLLAFQLMPLLWQRIVGVTAAVSIMVGGAYWLSRNP